MNTRPGAQRQFRDTITAPVPAPAAAEPRLLRERRAGDAARRALARWFGDSTEHAAVPGDK